MDQKNLKKASGEPMILSPPISNPDYKYYFTHYVIIYTFYLFCQSKFQY